MLILGCGATRDATEACWHTVDNKVPDGVKTCAIVVPDTAELANSCRAYEEVDL